MNYFRKAIATLSSICLLMISTPLLAETNQKNVQQVGKHYQLVVKSIFLLILLSFSTVSFATSIHIPDMRIKLIKGNDGASFEGLKPRVFISCRKLPLTSRGYARNKDICNIKKKVKVIKISDDEYEIQGGKFSYHSLFGGVRLWWTLEIRNSKDPWYVMDTEIKNPKPGLNEVFVTKLPYFENNVQLKGEMKLFDRKYEIDSLFDKGDKAFFTDELNVFYKFNSDQKANPRSYDLKVSGYIEGSHHIENIAYIKAGNPNTDQVITQKRIESVNISVQSISNIETIWTDINSKLIELDQDEIRDIKELNFNFKYEL